MICTVLERENRFAPNHKIYNINREPRLEQPHIMPSSPLCGQSTHTSSAPGARALRENQVSLPFSDVDGFVYFAIFPLSLL